MTMLDWKTASAGLVLCATAACAETLQRAAEVQPVQTLTRTPIGSPVDHPFRGTIALEVDARDVAHRVFTVREHVPVQRAGGMTLLYPRWEAASHGPSLNVTDLAGLDVSANGRPLAWRRDAIEPHAFYFDVPEGTRTIDVRFQIVANPDRLSADVVTIAWQHLLLYPAGWYARNIAVAPSVVLPSGLKAFTSLDLTHTDDDWLRFGPVNLEHLLDAPVLAGRYAARVPLVQDGPGAVTLDLIATRPDDLTIPADRVSDLRRMVTQTQAVFGASPFGRYEVLARMSDDGASGGTEHRASAEIGMASSYFRDWAAQLNNRDIVAHEFVHAWNGLYRVPADLWAPTPNVPQAGSLLWMYEGQTEFWARVLAARAGLRSREETLDKLAMDAAEVANRPGRAWRPLSDDVNYPSFMLRQSVPWRDWQRRKDYYLEGVMLWLDVDAILRQQSKGRRGIDDFAHDFFAGAEARRPARTYTFDDICAALHRVAPFDWTGDPLAQIQRLDPGDRDRRRHSGWLSPRRASDRPARIAAAPAPRRRRPDRAQTRRAYSPRHRPSRCHHGRAGPARRRDTDPATPLRSSPNCARGRVCHAAAAQMDARNRPSERHAPFGRRRRYSPNAVSSAPACQAVIAGWGRKARRRILPVGPFGSSGRMTISAGTL